MEICERRYTIVDRNITTNVFVPTIWNVCCLSFLQLRFCYR